MDLHAWITQQVDTVERLIGENEFPPSQDDGVRLRCEADRRILARHRIDPGMADSVTYAAACEGCGIDEWGLPNVDNLNDCPELLDLAHAHGLTDETLASLDRPTPPESQQRGPVDQAVAGIFARTFGLATRPITTSQVPGSLRGPRWKP